MSFKNTLIPLTSHNIEYPLLVFLGEQLPLTVCVSVVLSISTIGMGDLESSISVDRRQVILARGTCI